MPIMPRNRIERSSDIVRICEELETYLRTNNLSQNRLAKASGVPQYQISRLLGGRTKTVTGYVLTICNYANIKTVSGITLPCNNARLQNALGRVWDGSESSADLVATIIEAIGPLIKRLQALYSTTNQSRGQ